MPRPEGYIVKDAAVLTQSDLALSAAIEIIKDWLRHAGVCNGAKVFNAHYFWGSNFAGNPAHFSRAEICIRICAASVTQLLLDRALFSIRPNIIVIVNVYVA
jgi:hypothetical protein